MSTNSHRPARTNDALEHNLLSAWLTAADTGMCVLDDTTRIVILNPAACRMLNVDGLSLLNQPVGRLFESSDHQPLPEQADLNRWLSEPGLEGERTVTITSKIAAGKVSLLIKAQTVHAPVGGLFKVLAITDVTQLLAAQARIDSESARRHWQALNAGVVISDAKAPDMPIVYVNPKFEAMSGYSSAEILGLNCRFLQGNDQNQPGRTAIREAVKAQTNGYALLRNYRKDGSLFMNQLFVSPVRDGAGNVTHFVGVQHLLSDEAPSSMPISALSAESDVTTLRV